MPRLTTQKLLDDNRERLSLTVIAGAEGLSREFGREVLNTPGVGLVGHLNPVHPHRFVVLDRAELDYTNQQAQPDTRSGLDEMLAADPFAVVVASGLPASHALIVAARERQVPLLTSHEPGPRIITVLRSYTQRELGELTSLHGVFLDVLGVGVLITGDSSVGKSELALELISRGSGLVADDIVELHQIAPDTLQGRCPPLLRDFLEVRGLGVLNIRLVFGETAVRPAKNLRLIVHLERSTPELAEKIDRLQANSGAQTILGVAIPRVVLPVSAGRNFAVLVEAAVRNYVLQLRGIDSTREFIQRHEQLMANQQRLADAGH